MPHNDSPKMTKRGEPPVNLTSKQQKGTWQVKVSDEVKKLEYIWRKVKHFAKDRVTLQWLSVTLCYLQWPPDIYNFWLL